MDFIETQEQLEKAAKEWSKGKEIGIDIECENNLHHYGSYIALVQISTKDKDYVLDILAIKDFSPLILLLENKNVQKIFHDVGFDLRIIHKEFNCRPKNLFDTQMAALLLGKEHLSLGALLEEYLDIKKEKKFQMADWTKRPLTDAMLSYAVKDTAHLIKLKNILVKELKNKDRLSWVEEECDFIEDNEWEYNEGGFFDLKGIRNITDVERAVMKRLFKLRDKLAEEVDRPVHFIFPNKRMFQFTQDLPKDWTAVKGVHPIVKQRSYLFMKEVKQGLSESIAMPEVKRLRFSVEDKSKLEQLNVKRNFIAKNLGIAGHLIMNKEQMQKIVATGKMDCLRSWQKKLIE
jgi:ribonuclease D